MFARWATDDLIGFLRTLPPDPTGKAPEWEHYNLPLFDEHGELLVHIPGRDRAFYEGKRSMMERMQPGQWAALMMGEPRPREGRLFLAGAHC